MKYRVSLVLLLVVASLTGTPADEALRSERVFPEDGARRPAARPYRRPKAE